MGRNKGKQCGEFDRKCQNAHHRNTVYVDRASEANRYRNPMQIGSGQGYRNNAPYNNRSIGRSSGYWHRNGSAYGGGDKWSSIFSSSNRSSNGTNVQSSSSSIAAATIGLSHLRHLLEDRRSEDRVHDRQHRLRLQRSRMLVESYNNDMIQKNTSTKSIEDRHEAGWLLSYDKDESQHANTTNSIPSLQQLAARQLGPILPLYIASLGNEFVGEALKSVSADILSQLSITLAKNSSSDNDMLFATTDGVAKALALSGVLSELVLRGAPLPSLSDASMGSEDDGGDINDDARWLGDNGLLSLCPRILPTENTDVDISPSRDYGSDTSSHEYDDWEKIDFDIGSTQG